MEIPSSYGLVYLVDLENIGTHNLYHKIEEYRNAEYVIFHSDSTPSPGVILEKIPEEIQVSFVDCRSGGNNAMDFCICTMAGILSHEKKVIRILSDDKGYDPILYMLHQKGVRISRENTPNHPSAHKQNPNDKDQGWRENLPIIKAIRDYVPKQYQKQVIEVLPGAVNRKEAHEMLQAILPQKIVAEIYKKLKKHIPKEVV